MTNEKFSREYYIGVWVRILSSYQWWGHDLVTLLEDIEETNPLVADTFKKMYKKNGNEYLKSNVSSQTCFCQKLNELIINSEELYAKLIVKSLRKENNDLEIQESVILKRYDYMLAILCFMEEFISGNINDTVILYNGNRLTAYSQNINIFVDYDENNSITLVRIIIPYDICIEYYTSNKPI